MEVVTGSLSVVKKLILTWKSRHLLYSLPSWAWNVHLLPATGAVLKHRS